MQTIDTGVFDETRSKLETLRPARLIDIAARLGYPPSAVGMLSDVLHGRSHHVSATRLHDLRRRLGLPYTLTVPAIPCPTCGQLHQVGDCHGQSGAVAIIPAGARIVPPSKRKRPPYKRPTWAQVRALEARIAELEAQL